MARGCAYQTISKVVMATKRAVLAGEIQVNSTMACVSRPLGHYLMGKVHQLGARTQVEVEGLLPTLR